eukprot:3268235-Alexandrium_andersonii.AAC.1
MPGEQGIYSIGEGLFLGIGRPSDLCPKNSPGVPSRFPQLEPKAQNEGEVVGLYVGPYVRANV